ncbi:MAG: hypothetical protein ACI4DR_01705 [Roseburia sp.]
MKLVEETSTKVIYNYFPEQEDNCGTVTLDKFNGEIIDAKIACNDEHKRYMHHAVSRIIEFFKNGTYKMEDVVAWY